MQGKALLPIVKWSQRKDRVFLTVELRDIKNEKVDLQSDSLRFSGISDGQLFEFSINFFDEIKPEESKQQVLGFAMLFNLIKKNPDQPYWKRLTKETTKFQHIQVDWAKYIDEDDEQEEFNKGLDENWNSDNFQDFQGGQDEDDEENEEEPQGNVDDLEQEAELPAENKQETEPEPSKQE